MKKGAKSVGSIDIREVLFPSPSFSFLEPNVILYISICMIWLEFLYLRVLFSFLQSCDGSIRIPGLTERVCKTPKDILQVVIDGLKNRVVAGTTMNEFSSRRLAQILLFFLSSY